MAVTSSNRARVSLPTDEQILIEREFAAPRHLVYKAFTTPELVRRWWHANRGEVTLVEIDLRVGGRYRYAMTACDGLEVAFRGEYREVLPDERIVATEFYEGVPDGVAEEDATTLNTTTFAKTAAGTMLRILIEARSKMTRDAIIASGMEDGLQDALDLLEQVATSAR
jgi:uncharacterized protein YndB with AHSA1/START domain